MENAKISFRISKERKNSLIKKAKGGGLTLTQYIVWILDMYEEVNSMSVPQTKAEKTDLETPKIIKGSDTKFEAEFEKEILNAYIKGYQDGRKERIKIKP